MTVVTRILCITAGTWLLGGCTVYPMSRTYYEPMSDEGQLRNQPGCKFLHTRDTVRRQVAGIDVSVLVGPERAPAERPADLYLTLTLEGKLGNWNLQTDKVVVALGRSGANLRRDLATDESGANFTRWSLHYPEPAGLEDRIEVRFEPGALVVGGVAVELEPLHFRRVKKSDIYVGAFNCVE